MKKGFKHHLLGGIGDLTAYMAKTGKYILFTLAVIVSFHCYFDKLLHVGQTRYLWYLELLIAAAGALFLCVDFFCFHRWEKRKRKYLEEDQLITDQLGSYDNQDITEHAVRILEHQLNNKYMENCDLQDYVVRWCHEVKLPLSSALLLQEQIQDPGLRDKLREPLERIRGQLHSMLLGCRLQSSLTDVQVRRTDLGECVRSSIHNQQFFLIQKGFTLDIQVEGIVYTDQTWLVYILDQLIGNAIKYSGEQPVLRMQGKCEDGLMKLIVEDNGEGIRPEDIRHIYEKGFTGQNQHNGKYKSTGMGLYLVSRVLSRLGHTIEVESTPRQGTRFTLTFQGNPYDM